MRRALPSCSYAGLPEAIALRWGVRVGLTPSRSPRTPQRRVPYTDSQQGQTSSRRNGEPMRDVPARADCRALRLPRMAWRMGKRASCRNTDGNRLTTNALSNEWRPARRAGQGTGRKKRLGTPPHARHSRQYRTQPAGASSRTGRAGWVTHPRTPRTYAAVVTPRAALTDDVRGVPVGNNDGTGRPTVVPCR